jgi:hypothetical protein
MKEFFLMHLHFWYFSALFCPSQSVASQQGRRNRTLMVFFMILEEDSANIVFVARTNGHKARICG